MEIIIKGSSEEIKKLLESSTNTQEQLKIDIPIPAKVTKLGKISVFKNIEFIQKID